MIARHWRGWTATENADAYQELLSGTVLPGLKKISGYRGGYVLRRETAGEVEFVVVNLFDSIAAVQQFAGADYAVAQFEPEARRLLAKVEPLACHYEVCVSTVSD
jgi:heme-degrading monooxygenase HmoA